MLYLDEFVDFFRKHRSLRGMHFDDVVQFELQKTRKDLDELGDTWFLEPVDVAEKVQQNDFYKIYCYEGTFKSCFESNGIFHSEPGIPSTKTDENKVFQVKLTFYVNKKTNKVETIYEDFFNQQWGREQGAAKTNSLRKIRFWNNLKGCLSLLIFFLSLGVLIALGMGYPP